MRLPSFRLFCVTYPWYWLHFEREWHIYTWQFWNDSISRYFLNNLLALKISFMHLGKVSCKKWFLLGIAGITPPPPPPQPHSGNLWGVVYIYYKYIIMTMLTSIDWQRKSSHNTGWGGGGGGGGRRLMTKCMRNFQFFNTSLLWNQ